MAAHLLTDEEILAAMARGSEDMRPDGEETAAEPTVYDRTYRDLMAINGHLKIPTGTGDRQAVPKENLSMVNHAGSSKSEKSK